MPLTTFYVDDAGNLRQGLSEEEVRLALSSREGLLWADVGEVGEADRGFLEEVFNFHPLAVEMCISPEAHTAAVRDFGQYLFMVLHGINYAAESELVETTELDLFVGPNFVVSCHNLYLFSVASVTQQVEEGGARLMQRGADFLSHTLIDALVNNITPVVEGLSDRADDIEEEIFRRPHPTTLEAILHVKRSALRLRRAMAPQVEVLRRLSPQEYEHITAGAEVFYRDVHDRLARIQASVDNLRERADTILAIYLSAMAHQQNETMKILSVVALIFLPLSLLAGIYGMNFQYMPELAWRWGYFVVLGAMAAIATGVVWWFWARRWVAAGRGRLGRFVPAAMDPERLATYVGHMAHRPRR